MADDQEVKAGYRRIDFEAATGWTTEKNTATGNTRILRTGSEVTMHVYFPPKADGTVDEQPHGIEAGGSIEFVGGAVIIRGK